jgi:alanine racemase
MLADVSADGHGHGVVEAGSAALHGGAAWLAVSSVAEAIPLREAGIRAPVLASFFSAGGAQQASDLDVSVRGSHGKDARYFEPAGALYGLGADACEHGLIAAMRVSARVLITKQIEEGEGVSYGYTFRAKARTNLAMIAIGYADGLDRDAGNSASVFLRGAQRQIIGRVAMNAAVLDLGDDTSMPGDEAVLFGGAGEPSVGSWAFALGVSEDEVVTVFGRSLPRRYR